LGLERPTAKEGRNAKGHQAGGEQGGAAWCEKAAWKPER